MRSDLCHPPARQADGAAVSLDSEEISVTDVDRLATMDSPTANVGVHI